MSLIPHGPKRKRKRKITKNARAANYTIKNRKRIIHSLQKNGKNKQECLEKKIRKKNKRERRNQEKLDKERDRVKLLASQMSSILDSCVIESIARATSFLIRKAKITPYAFLIATAFGIFGNGEKSLELLGSNLKIWFGIDVSSQALSKRLGNKSTVLFLKKILERVILFHLNKCFVNSYIKIFKNFLAVKLEDSTCIELNERVAKDFKGFGGGGASKSALKMNVCYELTKNSVSNLEIRSATVQDQCFSESTAKRMKAGELLIRDLGYFNTTTMLDMIRRCVYFLSRLQKGVNVYLNQNDAKPIDLNSFLKKGTKNGNCIDQILYVGNNKVPLRFVAASVPQHVADKRLKKFKAHRRKEPTKDYVAWCGFSIFVTNIPKEWFGAIEIMAIYKIRWQIEIFFRTIKSTLKIHVIRGKNKNRVLSIIYMKLISLLLANTIVSYTSSICLEDEEVSDEKLLKWLKDENKFGRAIVLKELDKLIESIISDFNRICKNKRIKEKSSFRRLQEAIKGKDKYMARESNRSQEYVEMGNISQYVA